MTDRRKLRLGRVGVLDATPSDQQVAPAPAAPLRTAVALPAATVHRVEDDALYRKGEFDAPAADSSAPIRRVDTAVAEPRTRPRRGQEAEEPTTRPRRGPERTEQLDSLQAHKNPVAAKARKVLGQSEYLGTPDGKFSDAPQSAKRGAVEEIQQAERAKQAENDKKGITDKYDINVHQPVADLGEIYAHVGMLEAEFKHQVTSIAAGSKGKAIFRPNGQMKSLDRTMEKLVGDYGGDASRMVDVSGGSIAFANADDLVAAYGQICENKMFRVARLKNSLAKGKGYGDINMSLEMGGGDIDVEVDGKVEVRHHAGYIIELQLHLDPIIAAKADAHKDYEKQRSIDAAYGKKQVTDKAQWKAADRQEWQDLEAMMVEKYGKGWEKLGDAAAVASMLDAKIKVIKPK